MGPCWKWNGQRFKTIFLLLVYVWQAISLTRLIRICILFSNGYFVYTALEVRKMKMYDFKTRGGDEICLSDVKMHNKNENCRKTPNILACSKRSDSRERCEVKKAMKSRGGWTTNNVSRVAIRVSRVLLDGLQKKERLLVVYVSLRSRASRIRA